MNGIFTVIFGSELVVMFIGKEVSRLVIYVKMLFQSFR